MNKLTGSMLLIAVLSSGCAMTQRMDINDLNNMRMDCVNKDAQIKFLESQMPSQNDRLIAVLSMNSVSEFNATMQGKKTENRMVTDREYESVVKKLIWDLRTYCPSTQVSGTNIYR